MPRRKKTACRSRIVQIALTTDEYATLKARSENTIHRTLSDFIRAILFKAKIVTYYRNRSLDELLPVAGRIGDQLDTILRDWHRLIKSLRDHPPAADITNTLNFILKEEAEVLQTVIDIKSVLLKFIEDGSQVQDPQTHVHPPKIQ
ncbi:MAG TPA: hypothetical protein VG605_08585 [Puia sp.]|nr:hypothetical protein [Puia sp.]